MRIQKYIALCGAASRRTAEDMIRAGRVSLNGTEVSEMGVEIEPGKDRVALDGKILTPEAIKRYILLNKPAGYVTTVRDERGRPTVMALVESVKERIYPVGRLDADTEGLLLMTNDGNLANALLHPSRKVEKVYIARINRVLPREELFALENGVELDDGYKTAPAKAQTLKIHPKGSQVKISISEGKNRQVRRMLEAVGAQVYSLKRVAFGGLALGNLPSGKWRALSDAERDKLLGRGGKRERPPHKGRESK